MQEYTNPPEITLVLDRLRSAHNTGNIFRIAEAIGAKEIIACGYTPAPPHPKLAKTAMGTDTMVPCRVMPTSLDAIRQLRSEGIRQILAAECPDNKLCQLKKKQKKQKKTNTYDLKVEKFVWWDS